MKLGRVAGRRYGSHGDMSIFFRRTRIMSYRSRR